MFRRSILDKLNSWSQKGNRKPLVLRGARQVGKTTVVNEFGKGFKQYIYINLELPNDRQPFETHQDAHNLLQALFLLRGMKFADRADTLLFIDEIQEVAGAFNMLRYFYEDFPELRVIAAGSLLETIFNRGLTFPVGRVEFLVIRPASFPEFLDAMGEQEVLEQLRHVPLNAFAHQRLLELFHQYALIGGMPEVVDTFAASSDVTALSPIYESLIVSYLEDVEKYASNNYLQQVIRHCIRSSFIEAGQRIKFQQFGRSNYGSREVGEAFRTLEKTFIISLVYPSVEATLPQLPDMKRSPKLHVLDTGMINYFAGVQAQLLGTDDLSKVYQGRIIEHLVGQELLAMKYNVMSALHFWVREKKTSTAELDYIYPFEGQLIPIEAKSGKTGVLKSLHAYMNIAPHRYAVRVYAGPLSIHPVTTDEGKTYQLLNLPYFLLSQLDDYLRWFKEQVG